MTNPPLRQQAQPLSLFDSKTDQIYHQPQRPRDYHSSCSSKQEAIKYGDVFSVSGDLASKPIAPQDAATMQAAGNMVLGQTQKGGPAVVMQSAASVNERVGAVGHREATDIARNEGVAVQETQVGGGTRVITEEVGGQVLGRYVTPDVPLSSTVTIGEALEAAALSCGDKPVIQGGAAAIQAAEMRATRTNEITPGGVASMAQYAADINPRCYNDA
ncbi:late embryogenesis abundant protein d-34 [Quercus suber]|uniref:Late embryogenesis abundant protein d-34 n=1 Tax=Quercus suber TaxID=58331 RepID=A0AAW0IIJ3_QUESU